MSISLFKVKNVAAEHEKRQWNNQEIADFYRAADILERAGLDVEIDSGMTDEGEPWFVFVRSGDGEVLAHFAQIDGQFVAVSSLNHEVYKGSDIRQIVDQMLDKYPLVVPKNKSSGQLYLHPTAAVTAFLAAAFLLNIDGVKPTSIEEILVTVSTKGPAALADAGILVQANGKGDIAKWGQLDTASSNYNVVILGAALIANELGSSKVVNVKSADMEIATFDLNGDVVKRKAENDAGVLTKDLAGIVSSSPKITEQVTEQSDVKINHENNGFKVTSGKRKPKEDQAEKLNLLEKHFSNAGIVELSSKLLNSWGPSSTDFKVGERYKNNSLDTQKIAPYDVSENFVMVEQIYSSEIDVEDLSSVRTAEVFETSIFNFDLTALVVSENPQISLDNMDNISLIAFQGFDLTDDMVFLDTSFQNNLEENHTLGLSPFNKQLATSEVAESPSSIGTTTASKIGPVLKLPIIGHSTVEATEALDMTAGIDVVFYQGGDVEIKGFELGVDLLWFFLSEDELRAGRNTINSEGDVTLDFGEKGSLVFAGLVPTSPDDIFI